jgi:hypothetical protein
MTLDPLHGRHPSWEARCIYALLHRHGGTMRLAPLLRRLPDMDPRVFVDAILDLSERYWIRIVWHKAPPGASDDEPRPFTDIDRLCTTRFGRRKYRTTWPID